MDEYSQRTKNFVDRVAKLILDEPNEMILNEDGNTPNKSR